MGIRLVRRRTLSDGRIEEYEPKKTPDGYYVLADRAVDPQHNKAANQFYLKDLQAVAARVRRGGVSLRMMGSISGQTNLISASEIEIEEGPGGSSHAAPGRELAPDDDPFASFTEWSSEADEAAYGDL